MAFVIASILLGCDTVVPIFFGWLKREGDFIYLFHYSVTEEQFVN
jgi:hypothetical protein